MAATLANTKRLLDIHRDGDDDDAIELLVIRGAADLMAQIGGAIHKKRKTHGGSRPGKRANIDRQRAEGHSRLYADYFAPNPVYPDRMFRRRFRMSRGLFVRLLEAASAKDDYFRQKPDATGLLGLSPHQKITAALRMFCYGVSADSTDEYLRIGESTAMESFRRFAKVVIACFGEEYLRQPTADDIARHVKINERRGFPGMFGSLDCTHWEWKNCPGAWRGMFQDRGGKASIIMEAVATSNLWIWHSYIGTAGSNNDINVIDRSPLVVDWLQGHAPQHSFSVNGHSYLTCYLLCDGIYPRWSVFVKTINAPSTEKEKWFAKKQEAVRKDVERCFGVLQGRFGVLTQAARSWRHEHLCETWKACVIMHNMIIEDEELHGTDSETPFEPRPVASSAREEMDFDELLTAMASIRDVQGHTALQKDLVEHLWEMKQSHEAFFQDA